MGSFGKVYLAVDTSNGTDVAIKIEASNDVAKPVLKVEIALMRRLHGKGLSRVSSPYLR